MKLMQLLVLTSQKMVDDFHLFCPLPRWIYCDSPLAAGQFEGQDNGELWTMREQAEVSRL